MPGPATLLKAAFFAAQKHRDQRRKDAESSPYINHPLAVANVLSSDGGVVDETILVAALLHDTVEDTETTPAELDETFGPDVGRLVRELTDDKSLPKDTRKRLQIDRAPGASDAAKQLKIADKICNIRDIANSPPEDWSPRRKAQYLDWADRVVDGCRGVNLGLDAAYEKTVMLARRKLGLNS